VLTPKPPPRHPSKKLKKNTAKGYMYPRLVTSVTELTNYARPWNVNSFHELEM